MAQSERRPRRIQSREGGPVLINPKIKDTLDRCGAPYSLESGARHIKIVVGGRLAGILPYRDGRSDSRATLNTMAQIKRAAAKWKDH